MKRMEEKAGKNHDGDHGCADFMTMAERELAAFFNAVRELFGPEQAQFLAEEWLSELAAIDGLPASNREWRRLTARVSARLAGRVTASAMPLAMGTVA
jgi:hypothetical protein